MDSEAKTFDFKALGKRIRELRKERGLSTDEMGISRAYLCKVEINYQIPSLGVLEKLARKMNVTLADILFQRPGQLLENEFVREVAPYVKQLKPSQRAFILKTLEAAPKCKSGRTGKRILPDSSSSMPDLDSPSTSPT